MHKGYDYARVCEPDPDGARGVPRLARGRGVRARVLVRASAPPRRSCTSSIPGERVVCVNDVYGGIYRMFSQVYEPKGYAFDYVTPDEVSTDRSAPGRAHAARVDRDADEPAAQHRRHPRSSRCRARRRRAPRRRQHLRDAVPPAAARARRRHRRPLDDEVPRRPLRRHRRLHGDERPDDLGAAALPAEVARRGARAVRRLARAARAEDARRADAPALRERARGRRRSSQAAPGA